MADGFRLQGDDGIKPTSALNAMLALGLNTEGSEDIDPAVPGEKPGDFIRNYRLVDLLGEGGFGTVWRAQQLEPIQREVALKLIKPGMSSRAIMARFDAERQALAMMDHPNIAAVLDAGATSDGRSFFAMELVRGVPITAYCDQHHLTLRERIGLFLPVCDAVQHAHQKGIIHRDLKPSNILVTKCDRSPVPKVIDFGVAKALGSSDLPAFQASMLYTQVGAVIGTLQYMSPEQAGSAQDVDTRSDIYTLGVILYELLTGCTPFQRDECTGMAFDEALRYVREGQTSIPSSSRHFISKSQLTTIAGLRQLDPLAFKRQLRGDLDWVTTKALEKDRTRRYATAAAMADDLQRYLDGQPVSAVAPSWHYQFARFASRNRLALTTAFLVSTALIGGTAVSLWQASQAGKARAAAETSRILAEEKGREAEENLAHARTAVETYLGSVTSDPKLNQADFSDLRKSLLKSALPLYEEMLSRTGSPTLRGDQATALHRLAVLYQQEGDYPKAEDIHLKAASELQELLKAEPGNLSYQRELQEIYNDLGVLLDYLGDRDRAIEMHRSAIRIGESLSGEKPEAEDLHHLSTIFSNLGMPLEGMSRFAEAEQAYRKALAIELDLVKSHPKAPAFSAQAAVCYANLARCYFLQKKISDAEEAFREAIAIQEKLVRGFPDNPGHSNFLGQSYYGLGMAIADHDRQAAVPYFRQAIDLHELLSRKFPKDPGYGIVLTKSHLTLGWIFNELHRDGEASSENDAAAHLARSLIQAFPAVSDFPYLLGVSLERQAAQQVRNEDWPASYQNYRNAIEAFQSACTQQIANETYRHDLANACHGYAEMCLKSGRIAEAARQAGELPIVHPDQWQEFEFAASILAQAAEKAASDSSISADQLQGVIDTYRQKAVEFLRQAIAQGYPSVSGLRGYPAYRSLKDFRPFLELSGR